LILSLTGFHTFLQARILQYREQFVADSVFLVEFDSFFLNRSEAANSFQQKI